MNTLNKQLMKLSVMATLCCLSLIPKAFSVEDEGKRDKSICAKIFGSRSFNHSNQMTLAELPSEIHGSISQFLDGKGFCDFLRVCKWINKSTPDARHQRKSCIIDSKLLRSRHLFYPRYSRYYYLSNPPRYTRYDKDIIQLIINNFSQIQRLDICLGYNMDGRPYITDTDLNKISRHLKSLKYLKLDRLANITDAGLSYVSLMSNLKSLKLVNLYEVTDVGLRHVSRMSNLESLKLDNLEVTDVGLSYVSLMSNLENLELTSMCKMTDTNVGLLHVSQMLGLKSLALNELRGATDVGLLHVSQMLGLKSLALNELRGATDVGLRHVSQMSGLERLDLNLLEKVTGAGILHVSRMLNLEFLDLHGYWFFASMLIRAERTLSSFTSCSPKSRPLSRVL